VTRVTVLGSGSWGTAFAMIAADAGHPVALWSRRAELATTITIYHENPDYLPGITLPSAIRATADPAEALAEAEIVVIAVPSQILRTTAAAWAAAVPAAAVLVSLMKGIELGTELRMSEVLREVVGPSAHPIAVVSGPNLAREIAERQPAASVVACADPVVSARLQHAIGTSYFRPYTNTDVIGCELGGAVKNVIALAVGMAEGMGFGDNSRATLITRGLAETMRLGVVLGAEPQTLAGLAGLGDLVATCSSPLSRNRTFGENLGRGMTVAEVVAHTRQTAEGVKSCASILALARRHGVDMPITEAVVDVVAGRIAPAEMVASMMGRDVKPERTHV
jgi:glycerol-3-phosphate dehydrogenase (NAD(P)+)